MNKDRFSHHKDRDYFRSDEEWYFSWWLDDLKAVGLVDDWLYESEKLELSNKFTLPWEKKLKTKSKAMSHTVLRECTYEPDFLIKWNKSAKNFLYVNIEDGIGDPKKLPYFLAQNNETHIEIKPNFDQKNKTQQAIIKIKWAMQIGTYIQLVIPAPRRTKSGWTPNDSLFTSTFVPNRYLYCDNSARLRKINFPHKTVEEFLHGKT